MSQLCFVGVFSSAFFTAAYLIVVDVLACNGEKQKYGMKCALILVYGRYSHMPTIR